MALFKGSGVLLLSFLTGALFIASPALADAPFSDNFESYTVDQPLVGQGDWQGASGVFQVVNSSSWRGTTCASGTQCLYAYPYLKTAWRTGTTSMLNGSWDVQIKVASSPSTRFGYLALGTPDSGSDVADLGPGSLPETFSLRDNRSNLLVDNLLLNTWHPITLSWTMATSSCHFFVDVDHQNHPVEAQFPSGYGSYAETCWPSVGYALARDEGGINTLRIAPLDDTTPWYIDDIRPTPATTSTPTPTYCDPAHDADCYDNVMFLPGVEGSRLYRPDGLGGELPLWEPGSDGLVKNLLLDTAGSSIANDIYTKVGDILDEDYNGGVYYSSFINDMNALKANGAINDWEPIAYDWRLSPDQLLSMGKQDGTHISYLQATSTPYIIQELKRLAASSKTGKVTIIAHSNGGLVAKALMLKLGTSTTSQLIDKVILVASPQVGTPSAVGGLLYGYDQGYPKQLPASKQFLAAPATMRAIGINSPAANMLLPSAKYFEMVRDIDHPVVMFDAQQLYQKERAAYGSLIGNEGELTSYLMASDEGRARPDVEDIGSAEILNPLALSYATSTHASLDTWTPPDGVKVYQIAGWGQDTMSGIRYYEEPLYVSGGYGTIQTGQYIPRYEMMSTEDGDGTVVVPSALAMGSSTLGVSDYWVNLPALGKLHNNTFSHADIFETPEVRELIQDFIKSSGASLPNDITTSSLPPNDVTKKLRYFLHSPLTLEAYDLFGNHVGVSTTTGKFDLQIPAVTYDEFGDVKMLTVPADLHFRLVMHGYASGSFSLDEQQLVNGEAATTTSFIQIPTSTTTVASMAFDPSAPALPPLVVDEDGNGVTDFIVPAREGASVTVDTIAPVTTATTTARSTAGWYARNVAITLNSDDGPYGSGVASTTYSFDDLHWQVYSPTTPILISAEGTTTLWYRSSDKAGNLEAATSTLVRIDKTSPEAMIGFSTAASKIAITGSDNLTPVNVTSSVATTTLSDVAGNTLILVTLKNVSLTNYAALNISNLIYGTGTTTNATASLRYFWMKDKKGNYSLFISAIHTASERLIALYVPLLNKTYIVASTPADDDVDLSLQSAALLLRGRLKTLNGLVVPGIATKQGSVVVTY